ncbi:hypothetical protein QZH41_019936 [Actinostola sp. cb2023]|nr:hypothetical protein QZH41_019936 [Actinostola sp. cb2023]
MRTCDSKNTNTKAKKMQNDTDMSSDSHSDTSSESFHSTNEDFLPYDEDLEPIPNEQEAAEYVMEVARENEEEQMLLSRFSGEVDVVDWCKCSNCTLDLVVKCDECRCCMEVDRCREKMEEIDEEESCIIDHVAFTNVCLDTWVLEVAGIGLKTKAKRSYTAMLDREHPANSEYFRSVAYRQFVRLVWEYVGAGKRLPLPCCVYNAIRKAFPDPENFYKGYEEEEEEEEDNDDDSEESEDVNDIEVS